MNDQDSELEARILIAHFKALVYQTTEHWQFVAELIKQRSPKQVARMEQERGIG